MKISKLTFLISNLFLLAGASAMTPVQPLKCVETTVLVDDGVLKGPFKDNKSDIRVNLFQILTSEELYSKYLLEWEEAYKDYSLIDENTNETLRAILTHRYYTAMANYSSLSEFKDLVPAISNMYKIERSRCFVYGKPLKTVQYVYVITSDAGGIEFTVETAEKVPAYVNDIYSVRSK